MMRDEVSGENGGRGDEFVRRDLRRAGRQAGRHPVAEASGKEVASRTASKTKMQ